jgi:hypothetical protein
MDTLTWVRLVDEHILGGLSDDRVRLTDGDAPSILDVIEVEAGPVSRPGFQRENMQVGKAPWRKIGSGPPDEEFLSDILSMIDRESSYILGYGGEYCEQKDALQLENTLCLVEPKTIVWDNTKNWVER